MKAIITDSDALSAISPAEVAAYLRSQGWQLEREIGAKGAVWRLSAKSRSDYEILQPLRRDLGDYVIRLQEAFEVLAAAEDRSELAILSDIQDTGADVIRVRLQGAALQDGTLPIEQARQAVNHARELMLAAACAAVEPRLAYRTRVPQQAMDYLQRRVRLGQTERGSYVLTIRSLVPPRLTNGKSGIFPEIAIGEEEEPFERRVTLTLAQALAAVSAASASASARGDLTPFKEAVESGVSANLCAALVGLGGVATQGMEIGFRWSPTRIVPEGVPRQPRIVLAPDALPVLAEAARVFSRLLSVRNLRLEAVEG